MIGKSSNDKSETGPATEAAAERWLKQQGLRFITRNYRCRQGEIDLVMEDTSELVFVEVRYRKKRSIWRRTGQC